MTAADALSRGMVQHSRLSPGPDDREGADQGIPCGWVTRALRAARLEAAISEWLGAPRAAATVSEIFALVLAPSPREVRPGDEMLLPNSRCREMAGMPTRT